MEMFNDMQFKFWQTFGYEKEEINQTTNLEGIFIEIFDPTGKADDHIFEDFLKSPFITDVVPNSKDRENRINVIQKYPIYKVLQLEKKPNSEWIYFKPNINDLYQQIEAINNLQCKPRKEHLPLLKLFVSKKDALWPRFDRVKIDDWILLNDPDFPGVQNQRNFVEIALNTSDFAILEGPPGSGKTHTICEIILQAIKRNMRILLCASTHVAVDNVLEYLVDEEDVIAVRIGREDNQSISPKAKKFLLSERINTEKQWLIEKLTNLGDNINRGQQYFLDVLKSRNGETEIERMILNNANLICGTTIGILQHPAIREERSTPRAVFDILIIDEASKTTLQEFIVPALYCRKWVMVGDVRQLSPFVDAVAVRKSVEGLLNDNEKTICRDTFCLWKFSGFNLIISEPNKEIRDKYKLQFDSLKLEYFDLETVQENASYQFLASKIFIGTPELVKQYENHFPMDTFLRGKEFGIKLKFANNYWTNHIENEKISTRYRGSFGDLIAWRLIRLFDLRFSEGDLRISEISQDIDNLLPYWKDDTELQKDLSLIKKIAFPSILEIIQEGFHEIKKENLPYYKMTVSTHGFNSEDKEIRYGLLEYQHRMHPEISKFSREQIYQSKALRDNQNLRKLREWNYKKYASRIIWVNILTRNSSKININLNEAHRLLEELKFFLDFSKNNLKNGNEFWDVAVLTFYSYQEELLRTLINGFFGRKMNLREFVISEYNINIKICTVDRFQGHEADIVFLSFVKTNSVGFLNSLNRLNVAITRARYQLVMIGNKKFFLDQKISPTLKELAKIQDDISIN